MDEEVTQEQADRAEAAARRSAALQLHYYPRDPRAVPLADKGLELQVLNLLLLAAPRKEIKKGINESMWCLVLFNLELLMVLLVVVQPLEP